MTDFDLSVEAATERIMGEVTETVACSLVDAHGRLCGFVLSLDDAIELSENLLAAVGGGR